MRWTEIEAFRALMRSGTTHKAAQLLGVTQPAVSQGIKRLEAQAGLNLFQRRGGRLVPTPEANALMTEVDRAFIGMEAVEHRLNSIRDFGLDRLELSCYPAFGLGFMPRALAKWRQQLDGVPQAGRPQVSLQVLSSKDVREQVQRGLCDFGLMADELPLDGIDHSSFARMNGVVVIRDTHALARFRRITPAHLAQADFIALNPEDASRKRLEAAMTEHGLALRVAAHTPYAASVCEMALHGLGVGLVNPMTALDYADRGLVARRLSIDIEFACMLVLPATKVLSRTAQAFLAVMRHQYGDDEKRIKAMLK